MKRLFVVFFMLSCIFASSVAAQCYPPGTRVVIFMQGVYSSLDAEGTNDIGWEDHAFDRMKAQFVAAGYNESQLLDFSYNGGEVSTQGTWTPDLYGCADTDRVSDRNLAVLEQMMRDYRAKHPNAHFTLVGHSLGGYLAYLEGVHESARPDAEKLHVDAVVTLHAPLNGVSADKKLALDASISCPKTYNAAAEIVADKLNPQHRRHPSRAGAGDAHSRPPPGDARRHRRLPLLPPALLPQLRHHRRPRDAIHRLRRPRPPLRHQLPLADQPLLAHR